MTKLYLAYGSNMNRAQMPRRCPAAKPVGPLVIDDARLVFRGVADIEYHQGGRVPVVLWSITDACELALDGFEGVSRGVYEKKMIPLDNGEEALTYVMCSGGIAPPTREYFDRIARGYADFGIDCEPLDIALKHSHVKLAHSPETRRRLVRNIAQGVTSTAPRPRHVPLSAVQDASRSGKEYDLCVHGWPSFACNECEHERYAPPSRPLEGGYNWSQKARANSKPQKCGPFCQCASCEYNRRAAKRAAAGHKDGKPTLAERLKEAERDYNRSKDGKPKGRKVSTDGRSFETVHKRTNKVVKKTRQTLDDYMKEKGYH